MTLSKKLLMAVTACLAISFIGCEDTAAKKAGKLNDESSVAYNEATEGSTMYSEAHGLAYYVVQNSGSTAQDYSIVIEKLVNAKSKLQSSKAHYLHILKVQGDNKDEIKLLGKDSIYQNMDSIDKMVVSIDADLTVPKPYAAK